MTCPRLRISKSAPTWSKQRLSPLWFLSLPVTCFQMFWRPFGKYFVAVLISHLKYCFFLQDLEVDFSRRHKITEEGAFVLVRDMDEYYNVEKNLSPSWFFSSSTGIFPHGLCGSSWFNNLSPWNRVHLHDTKWECCQGALLDSLLLCCLHISIL